MKLPAGKIPRMIILALAIMAALSVTSIAQSATGWHNPTDTDWGFLTAWRAFTIGNGYAWAWDGATCDYWGYGFEFKPGMRIVGIEVRLDAKHVGTPGASELDVCLTGDGGSSWTMPYNTTVAHGGENTYILGGHWDGWGRDWSPSELGDSEFGVRITAHMNSGLIGLEWVGVRVFYSSAFSMEILSGAQVGFPPITGAHVYTSSAGTSIRITSPDPWSMADEIIWEESRLDGGPFPDAFNQDQVGTLLSRDYDGIGEAGQYTVDVTYRLDLTGDNLRFFQSGTYSLVIRYTATTND